MKLFLVALLFHTSLTEAFDSGLTFRSGFIQYKDSNQTTHKVGLKLWKQSNSIEFQLNSSLALANDITETTIEQAFVKTPLFSFAFQEFALYTGRFSVQTTTNRYIPAFHDTIDGFGLVALNSNRSIQVIFDALLNNPVNDHEGYFTKEPVNSFFKKSQDSYRFLFLLKSWLYGINASLLAAMTFYGNDAIHNRDLSGNGLWGDYADNDYLTNIELLLEYQIEWFVGQPSNLNLLCAISHGYDKKLAKTDVDLSGQSIAISFDQSFHKEIPKLILFGGIASQPIWENSQQVNSGYIRLPGRSLREMQLGKFTGYTTHPQGIFYDNQLAGLMNFVGAALEHTVGHASLSLKLLFQANEFQPSKQREISLDYQELSGNLHVNYEYLISTLSLASGKDLLRETKEKKVKLFVQFRV